MSDVISTIAVFSFLALLIWLANVAEHSRVREQPYRTMEFLSYGLVSAMYSIFLLIGLYLQFGQSSTDLFNEQLQIDSLFLLATGIWLPSLLAIFLLFPSIRRFLALFLPIDPESPVHAVALSLSMLILIYMLFTLGIGLGNVSDILAAQEDGQGISIGGLWAQQLATALFALIGVGWMLRQDWSQAMDRLGITIPSGSEILLGVSFGIGMVPIVIIFQWISNSLLGIGFDPDVESLSELLLGPLFQSPFGVITLGLAAALGEETVFRGALQPRFGLVLTTLLFAIVHSNYGITFSTFIVFVLGFVLGLVRQRTNTTTAMIMHAVYNSSLGLIAYLGLNFLEGS
ncbi:CPBP family intramembrane metalloprotease [Chloroflexi bacterium TSY]|nr:CPBP family intramembrane metalloprotease [Chloroflexi bacterium TSY]